MAFLGNKTDGTDELLMAKESQKNLKLASTQRESTGGLFDNLPDADRSKDVEILGIVCVVLL